MLPLLKERTVRVRWGLTVSEYESEVVSLGAGPLGGEHLEPIVAQDAQAKLDERAATGVASMSNLLAANPLRGGPGGGPPSPVTLGVRVSMLEQQLFSLDGPILPSGRGRAEVLVVGPSGIFSQEGLDFVKRDPSGSDQFVPQSAMEVATQAKSDGDMIRERHGNRGGMRRGEQEGVHKPIEIAPMLLSGLGGMGNPTMPMPLSSEIGRGSVPIPS